MSLLWLLLANPHAINDSLPVDPRISSRLRSHVRQTESGHLDLDSGAGFPSHAAPLSVANRGLGHMESRERRRWKRGAKKTDSCVSARSEEWNQVWRMRGRELMEWQKRRMIECSCVSQSVSSFSVPSLRHLRPPAFCSASDKFFLLSFGCNCIPSSFFPALIPFPCSEADREHRFPDTRVADVRIRVTVDLIARCPSFRRFLLPIVFCLRE